MRQTAEDRALYYRQLRQTLRTVFLPELTSAQAIDAAGLVDRILAEFIVEEEQAAALTAEFGPQFAALLNAPSGGFDELRAGAADAVARGDARSRDLVDVERALLEQVDELRTAVFAEGSAAGPAPEGCSITAGQLTEYLRRKLRNSPEVVVEHLEVIPGGRSKETILVTLGGTRELPEQVIMRKDRPVGVLQTRAADEFAVMRVVHDFGGVPIPEPFFAERDGHGLGDGTFEVMERVRGHKAGEFFPDLAAPTQHRQEIGRQLAVSLARLHALPLDRLRDTGLDVGRAAVTEDSVAAAVEGMVARIGELTGVACVTVPLAREWLLDHLALVAPAARLCLLQGDFGLHNTLIDGDRVTALVDWEAAAIAPPARELAAAWNAAHALTDWSTFVRAYVDAGGSPDDADPGAISFYRVFAALGGLMTSKLGGHLFRTGAKRDLLTAHSGLDSYFRCSRNLARALHDAM